MNSLTGRVEKTESGLTAANANITSLKSAVQAGNASGGDLIPNPTFDPTYDQMGFSVVSTTAEDVPSGCPYGYAARIASRDHHPNFAAFPATLNDAIEISALVACGAGTANFNLYVGTAVRPDTSTGAPLMAGGGKSPSATWQRTTWRFKVTQAMVDRGYIRPFLQISQNSPYGTVWFVTDWHMRNVTAAQKVQDTADATAAAVDSLTTTVTQQGNLLTSTGNRTTQLENGLATTNAAVAKKADATAVQDLTNTVKQLGNDLTAANSAITKLTGNLANTDKALAQKADATALATLDTKVTQQGKTLESQSNSLTNLSNSLSQVAADIDASGQIPGNLVVNPSFERGLDGYTGRSTATSVVEVSAPHSGTRALKVDPGSVSPGQYIPFVQGRTYEIGVWVKEPGATTDNGAGNNKLRIGNSAGQPVFERPYNSGTVGTNWSLISGRWKATETASLPVTMSNYLISGSRYFDDFYVTDVTDRVDIDATAGAVTGLTNRVSTAEGHITSQSQQLTNLQNSLNTTNAALAKKAEASAVTALTQQVEQNGQDIRSNTDSITSLSNQLVNGQPNSWSRRIYSVQLANAGTVPSFSDIRAVAPVVVDEAADAAKLDFTSSGSYLIALYSCQVKVAADTTITMAPGNRVFDDTGAVFVNGVQVAWGNASWTTVSFDLKAGWNTVEFLVNQWTGQAYINLGLKLSDKVAEMYSGLGVSALANAAGVLSSNVSQIGNDVVSNSQSITQLRNALTQTDANVASKADQTAMNSLTGRVEKTESGLTAANANITSLKSAVQAGNASGGDLIPNPTFDPTYDQMGFSVVSTTAEDVPSGCPYGYAARIASRDHHPNFAAFPATLNDAIEISALVACGAGTANFNLYVGTAVRPDTSTGAPLMAGGGKSPSATWQRTTWRFKVTQAMVDRGYIRPFLQISQNSPYGTVWFVTDWHMRNVTAAQKVQDTADATAAAVDSLTTTVTQQGNLLTSTGNRTTQLENGLATTNAAVAKKADATAVQDLTNTVKQLGNDLTAANSAITKLTGNLANTDKALAQKADATALATLDTKVTQQGKTLESQSNSLTNLSNSLSQVAADIDASGQIPGNLVVNPSFERGLDGYTGRSTATSVVEVSAPHSGTRALKVDPGSVSPGQYIPFVQGRTYEIGVWVKEPGATTDNGAGNNKLRIGNSAGQPVFERPYNSGTVGTNWSLISGRWKATETASLPVTMSNYLISGSRYFDDFYVTDVTDRVDIDATAGAVTGLTNRVSTAEGHITSQSQQLTNLQNSLNTTNAALAKKAEASAVTALTQQVEQNGQDIRSNTDSITSLSNQLVNGQPNSWSRRIYPVQLANAGTVPSFSDIRAVAPVVVDEVADAAKLDFTSVGSYLIALYSCQVKVAADTTITMAPGNRIFDDTGAVFVNGVQVAWGNASWTTGSFELKAGWNTVEFLVNQWTGQAYINLGLKLSDKVAEMYSGLGVSALANAAGVLSSNVSQIGNDVVSNSQSITQLRNALTQTDANVASKADQTAMNSLTGRVEKTESGLTAANSNITSLSSSLSQQSKRGANLLPDGTFESYAVGHNLANNRAIVTTDDSHGGNKCIRVTRPNDYNANATDNTDTHIFSGFQVRDNAVFYMECWVKLDAKSTAMAENVQISVGLSLQYQDNSWQWPAVTKAAKDLSSTQWTKVSGYLKSTKSGIKQAMVRISIPNVSSVKAGNSFLIDDLVITEVTDAYNAQSTADANANAISTLNSTVSQQGDQITSQGNSITKLTNDLATTNNNVSNKADANALTALTNRVTQTEKDINSTSSSVTNLNNKVDSISVGGTNLIKNSGDMTGWSNVTSETYRGNAVIGATVKAGSGYKDLREITLESPVDAGEYVYSFYAKGGVAGQTMTAFFYNPNTTTSIETSQGAKGNNTDGRAYFTLTTSWVRYWVKWKQTPTTGTKRLILCRIESNTSKDQTVYINSPKFEVGNVVSDWNDSPADSASASAVDLLTTTVNQQGTSISSIGNRTTSLENGLSTAQNNIARKADASALQDLRNTVTSQGGDLTAANSSITSLQASMNRRTVFTVTARGNGNSVTPGVFDESGKNLFTPGRSWALVTFAKHSDGSTVIATSKTYDVFGSANNGATMSADIEALASGTYVCVLTFDEPSGNRGKILSALESLGGTSEVVNSLPYRGAYILLGRKGMRSGDGLELRAPTGGDATAHISTSVEFVNGIMMGLGAAGGVMMKADANASAITTLQNTVKTQGGNIDSLSSSITALENSLRSTNDTVSKKADTTAVSSLTGRVSQVENTITSQSQSITSLTSSINTISTQGANPWVDGTFESYGDGHVLGGGGTAVVVASQKFTGNKSLQVSRGANNNGNSDKQLGSWQSVREDAKFRFEFWAMMPADQAPSSGWTTLVGINSLNAAGQNSWQSAVTVSEAALGARDKWVKFTGIASNNGGGRTRAVVWISTRGASGSGTPGYSLYIDDLVITDVTDAKAAQDASDATASAVSGLTARVTDAEGKITAQAQQQTALATKVDNANSRVDNMAKTLSDSQSTQASLNTSLQSQIDAQAAANIKNQTTLDNTIKSVASITSTQQTHATALAALATQQTTLTSSVGDLSASVQNTAKTVADVNGTVSSLWSMKVETVNGKNVGAGITLGSNGETSDMILYADRFSLFNRNNATAVPVMVAEGNELYIDTARIKNSSLTSAKIADGSITNAKIGNEIRSNNFVDGSQGWRIAKDGSSQFNNVIVRGRVEANSGVFRGTVQADSFIGDIAVAKSYDSLTFRRNQTVQRNGAYQNRGYSMTVVLACTLVCQTYGTGSGLGYTSDITFNIGGQEVTRRIFVDAGNITGGTTAFELRFAARLDADYNNVGFFIRASGRTAAIDYTCTVENITATAFRTDSSSFS